MISEKTIKALNRNHIQAEYVKNREVLLEKLRKKIPEGSMVAAGRR